MPTLVRHRDEELLLSVSDPTKKSKVHVWPNPAHNPGENTELEVTTKPIPHPFIGEFRKQFGQSSDLPDGYEGNPMLKSFELISREVKPWPGDVDVEGMPEDGKEEGDS